MNSEGQFQKLINPMEYILCPEFSTTPSSVARRQHIYIYIYVYIFMQIYKYWIIIYFMFVFIYINTNIREGNGVNLRSESL